MSGSSFGAGARSGELPRVALRMGVGWAACALLAGCDGSPAFYEAPRPSEPAGDVLAPPGASEPPAMPAAMPPNASAGGTQSEVPAPGDGAFAEPPGAAPPTDPTEPVDPGAPSGGPPGSPVPLPEVAPPAPDEGAAGSPVEPEPPVEPESPVEPEEPSAEPEDAEESSDEPTSETPEDVDPPDDSASGDPPGDAEDPVVDPPPDSDPSGDDPDGEDPNDDPPDGDPPGDDANGGGTPLGPVGPRSPEIPGGLGAFHLTVIGSSTAGGIGASADEFAWGSLLDASLAATVTTRLTTSNLAVGGYTAKDLLPGSGSPGSIDDAIAEKPDLIVVALAGSNDLAGPSFTTEMFIAELVTVREAASAAGIPAFFMGTLPKNLSPVDRETLEVWNHAMAEEFGQCWIPGTTRPYAPCYMDVFDILADGSLGMAAAFDSGDGQHPNDAGHALLFNAVNDIVTPYVCTKTACR